MSSEPPRPRRQPYWLVAVFAALMLSPPAWAAGALIAATVTVIAARAVRAHRAQSRRSAAAGDGGLIGVDVRGDPIELTDHQLSAHALIVGASGAGKTTTLLTILTDQIRRGHPVVAIDLKGSPAFARELAQAAAGAGRRFALWTLDGPGRWNPLRYGNATELKDKLIGTERFTEPHYQRAAERYLQTVLQVLEYRRGAGDAARAGAEAGGSTGAEAEPTLDEVVDLMDPLRLAAALRRLPRSPDWRVEDYLAGLTPDQLSGIRGFATRLAILSESHTGRYLTPASPNRAGSSRPGGLAHAIDLRCALAGDDVVLFSLNSSKYGKLSAQIGALVIQDLIAASGRRLDEQRNGTHQRQAIVAIDEFSALGGDHVAALFARAREARLSVVLVTQELADLERAGPGLRDLVIGNTAVKIAHRQDVPGSAQTIAQIAGTKHVWERSYHEANPWPLARSPNRTTRRQVEQFVVHPNEIKTLATGEAVLITKLPVSQAVKVWVAPAHAQPAGSAPARSQRAGPAPAQSQLPGPAPAHPQRAGPAPAHSQPPGPAPAQSQPDRSGRASSRPPNGRSSSPVHPVADGQHSGDEPRSSAGNGPPAGSQRGPVRKARRGGRRAGGGRER